ncbi:MAG TPA: VOC family protein [Pseudonocardia sp.]|nr:VOC family protein [Pseudonocardia sp.]
MSSTDTMAAPALAGYHHVSLTVTDVDASERWYARVLGLHRVMVEPHADGGHSVVLARPGTSVFLGLAAHPTNAAEAFGEHRTGLDHLSLAVGDRADLDTWREHLDALDVPHSGITEATEPFEYALIVFRDPDNIQLEVTWS